MNQFYQKKKPHIKIRGKVKKKEDRGKWPKKKRYEQGDEEEDERVSIPMQLRSGLYMVIISKPKTTLRK